MKRRGNHEGTIWPHKKGGFAGRVVINGRPKVVYAKTERLVRQKMRQAVSDSERGIAPTGGNVTVGDYLDRWLEDVVKPDALTGSPRTYEAYEYHVRLHLRPALGAVKLKQLRAEQLQRLYADLLKRGLSPKTVRNCHGCIASALEQALKWGLVATNVARQARPPKYVRPEQRTIDPGEILRLWSAAEGTRWAPLIILTCATGLRQSEILGLKWGDVDFERSTLAVRRQLQRNKTFREPKAASRRTLDLTEGELRLLADHRARQDALRRAQGERWEGHDLIFCTDLGRPLIWRNVTREFKRFARRAELPAIRFHDLRHSNGTILAAAGIPLKVIQERLGHSDARTTLQFYGHATPPMGRDAARALQGLLHGRREPG